MKNANLITTLVCLFFGVTKLSAQDNLAITRSGHVPAGDLYKIFYVPFAVPEGIAKISVKQTYSGQAQRKNVLNLGIYGPQGYQLGNPAGFRGWSGGGKTEFFISAREASTSYIPGKIDAGTWNIIMYASTITAEGIDWKLEITLTPGPDGVPFQMTPAAQTVNNKPGWYRGDLHMHTYHSDGKRTQQELVNEALATGLDFIVSTEHNTNSANLSWGGYPTRNLLVLNGEEVTTTDFGHWNAIGINPQTYIDWRYSPQDSVIGDYIHRVHDDNGLAIVNHPFYANKFIFDVGPFDGIEVWNGPWDKLDEQAVKWWDQLLRQGKIKLAIAASDTHTMNPRENRLGIPQTIVYANSLSRQDVMAGLKAGKAYLARDHKISLSLVAACGDATAGIGEKLVAPPAKSIRVQFSLQGAAEAVITLHSDKGVLRTGKATAASGQFGWDVPAGSARYLRVEARTPQGDMLALTNPVWLQ